MVKQRDRETAGHRLQGGSPGNEHADRTIRTGTGSSTGSKTGSISSMSSSGSTGALVKHQNLQVSPAPAPVVAAAAGSSVKHQDSQKPPAPASVAAASGASVKHQDPQKPPATTSVVAASRASVQYQGRTRITCESAHGRISSSSASNRTTKKVNPQRQKAQLTHTLSPASEPVIQTPRYLPGLSTCRLRCQDCPV